jgi:hypothetical protein
LKIGLRDPNRAATSSAAEPVAWNDAGRDPAVHDAWADTKPVRDLLDRQKACCCDHADHHLVTYRACYTRSALTLPDFHVTTTIPLWLSSYKCSK